MSVNILDNMDKKKGNDFSSKLDDESVSVKDYSDLLNLQNIKNVCFLRINLESGAIIDVEMEGSKLNLIYGMNTEDLSITRMAN